ncbi:MFS transporter [Fusibacter sp. 3D3]|uniref:MFS transporter n=1 Tax=Fusibacter sp. 3D3 TaxID=1048380 RepID=UPI00085339C0|nr:MFS transporter [Fusibacter sp. 3D3]GAU77066.1 multidrug-efflux transporter [Fusibacter sp. 3D3]
MEQWKSNLYILWIAQIISLTSFGFGLPFMPFYIQDLGVTDPTTLKLYTGLLSAAPAVTMAIMAPVWGMLSDRYGRKMMIQRAMFTAFFIIGLMGMVSQVWQLLILRFLQGLFTGTITASSTFVAANTPNNRLSYALGFLSSSTFIGYSLGPVMGGFVAEQFGYRISFFSGAVLMLVGAFFITYWLVEDKSSLQTRVLKGHTDSSEKKRVLPYGQILTVSILLMLLMLFFHRITRTVFSPFIPLYIQELRHTKEGAAAITGYVNGFVGFMTTIAALSISRLGDRYNKFNLISLLMGLAIGVAIILNLSHSLYAFIGLYGVLFLLIGGIEPLITSMTAELTVPEYRGSLFGLQGLVGSLGWMVSPAIGTYISIYIGIKNILWIVLVMLILNFLVISVIKHKNARESYE